MIGRRSFLTGLLASAAIVPLAKALPIVETVLETDGWKYARIAMHDNSWVLDYYFKEGVDGMGGYISDFRIRTWKDGEEIDG